MLLRVLAVVLREEVQVLELALNFLRISLLELFGVEDCHLRELNVAEQLLELVLELMLLYFVFL